MHVNVQIFGAELGKRKSLLVQFFDYGDESEDDVLGLCLTEFFADQLREFQ